MSSDEQCLQTNNVLRLSMSSDGCLQTRNVSRQLSSGDISLETHNVVRLSAGLGPIFEVHPHFLGPPLIERVFVSRLVSADEDSLQTAFV